jgi:hypothetical protein
VGLFTLAAVVDPAGSICDAKILKVPLSPRGSVTFRHFAFVQFALFWQRSNAASPSTDALIDPAHEASSADFTGRHAEASTASLDRRFSEGRSWSISRRLVNFSAARDQNGAAVIVIERPAASDRCM